MRDLNRQKMRIDYHERIPLTRLLLDSNFVSITDMVTRNREDPKQVRLRVFDERS